MGYITLICDRCRLTVRVEFARSLKEGRPHCCNQKMRLVKTREDVDEAVKQSTTP